MRWSEATAPFMRHPMGSLGLALACAAMAVLFAVDALPAGLKHGPFHGAVMAALCALLAAFFGVCAWAGRSR